jgi:hypothetical protein
MAVGVNLEGQRPEPRGQSVKAFIFFHLTTFKIVLIKEGEKTPTS